MEKEANLPEADAEGMSSEPSLFAFIQEYQRLLSLPELSETDAEKMSAILELAQYDDELNTEINKVDHLASEVD